MGFLLYKLVSLLFVPINIIFLLILSGAFLLIKGHRMGIKVIGCGLFLLIVLSLPALPRYLIHVLENRVSAGKDDNRAAGIIVLTGGAIDMSNSRKNNMELGASVDRIIDAILLAKKYPGLKLVITGGADMMNNAQDLREADYMKELSVSLGIDEQRLIVERNSRSTREHPVELEKILDKKKSWILITSAYHMPRAFSCFRKRGFDIIPYPVDYRTQEEYFQGFSWLWFLPRAGNITLADAAIHEYLGLLFYRLAGYTDSLFPERKVR